MELNLHTFWTWDTDVLNFTLWPSELNKGPPVSLDENMSGPQVQSGNAGRRTFVHPHTCTCIDLHNYIGLHTQIHTSAVDAYWKIYLNAKPHIGLSSLYFYLVGKPDHDSTGKYGFSYNSLTHKREHVCLFAFLYAQWLQISYPWGNVPQHFLTCSGS